MYVNRDGEQGLQGDRSERFFQMDATWYFAVRGGRQMGPYQTKRDAIRASGEYIRGQSKLNMVRAAAGNRAMS
ncbi:MAG: DUF6316 family protein [Pseudomonadales bacterium]|jgi:hypothetical protein|nr:DUF6316 family protein [Pseudomonadales bacterium]